MNFLPIVERELRVASRRPATYWGRLHMAALVMVPTFLMLWEPTGALSVSQRGAMIFGVISTISLYGVVFAAARWTADCISSEKREGTLGFLFLTDLKPRDVLLGKLSANSLGALYGLLAILPVLAIPLMLGGVTIWDVLLLAVVLLNTIFFALSVAVLVSTFSWQQRQAVSLTVIFLMGAALGVPAVAGLVGLMAGGVPMQWLMMLSPTFAAGMITSYAAAPWAFWLSVSVTHLMGWLLFAVACRVLPRVWQDRPAEGTRLRWRNLTQAFLLGRIETRKAFRRALLDVNPIFWFASRERRLVWYPWLVLASVFLLLVVWPVWQLGMWGVGYWAVLMGSFCVNWFFKHWIVSTACAAFSADRDKGAMELLLSTPLRASDFLRGHAMALRRQFMMPLVTLVAVESLLLVMALATDKREDNPLLMTAWIAAVIVMLVPDVIALVWAGWWAGLVAKTASVAGGSAYVRVLVPPFALILMAAGWSALFLPQVNGEFMGWLMLGCWFGGGVVTDVVMASRARRKLVHQMRTVVIERYTGGDPAMIWWRRLGRRLGRWAAGGRA